MTSNESRTESPEQLEQLNVRLPEYMGRRIRLLAQYKNTTLQATLRTLIEDGLNEYSTELASTFEEKAHQLREQATELEAEAAILLAPTESHTRNID